MSPYISYTLVALCLGIFAFGFWVGGRPNHRRFGRLAKFSLVFQLAAFVSVYFVLAPGEGDDGPADIQAAMAKGQPVFIDVYSNF